MYFTVVRVIDYAILGTIPYDKALLNIGNAMDIRSGKFTAPKKGTYFFSLTIYTNTESWATIDHNNVVAVATVANEGLHSASAQATLQLEPGDVVYTSLGQGKLYSFMQYHQTHFTGYLLQEL